jgi:small-conductance mechanosensitive channel
MQIEDLIFIQQTTTQTPQNIQDVFIQLQKNILDSVPGLLTGFILLFIFWLLAAVGTRIISFAAPRVKADTHAVILLSRVYYYTILIFGFVIAISSTGLNVGGLVAGLGLTGFALGFALKDVLANLLSGMMLLLYRPFNIGDNITMDKYTGKIETIRMRDTVLRDEDGRLIIIPNSKLITEVVVNNSNAEKKLSYIDDSSKTEKEEKKTIDEALPESFSPKDPSV